MKAQQDNPEPSRSSMSSLTGGEQTNERESEQLIDVSSPEVGDQKDDGVNVKGQPREQDVGNGRSGDVVTSVSKPTPEAPNADKETQDSRKETAKSEAEIDVTEVEPESRADIEEEASVHLARRAAEMTVNQEQTDQEQLEGEAASQTPIRPQTPTPRHKGDKDGEPKGKGKEAAESEYDEKHPPVDVNNEDVPEAPQGTNEQTGLEIQTIIDQFQTGIGAPGEQEIMSPRLEKQQPILQLPPRSSSLEPVEKYTIMPKPGIERRDSEAIFGSPETKKAPLVSSARAEKSEHADDTASVTSHRTSIFQPPPPSPDPEPPLQFDFHRFLEQLKHRTADPVARFLRSFLQEFGKKQWAVHEQVKIISDFLEFISKKMGQCEVWRTVSDAEFDNAREGMEKLVMNRLYSQTFSPAIPPAVSPRKSGRGGRTAADAANPHGPGRRGQHEEDVERDTVIAQKIRIYGWISEEHLDIKPIGEKGKKFLTLAQQELLKITTYRAPRDKVICVLNACKVIFGFLKNSKADQSADAFVPLLIYTVLRAAPENLVSNVQYIWRFRNQDKLGGEAGYYMSSLMGVVTFIEGLDRTSLTISDEDFETNVERAVSAIAEGHKAEEYEARSHGTAPTSYPSVPVPGQGLPGLQHLSEKSSLSRPEVTPRNSMEAEQSSPRKYAALRASEKSPTSDSSTDDDYDAVSGLLRTIQKPLSSIGRMFSDEPPQRSNQSGLQPGGSTSRARSPNKRNESYPGNHARSRSRHVEQQRDRARAEVAAVRQESAQTAEAHRHRVREERLVVDTLQGMFPNLDQEVIADVVRSQDGNVGRAVDACLALNG